MKKLLIIKSKAELSRFHNRINLYPADVIIKIDFADFSKANNALLTQQYNRWIKTCGCKEGAITGFLSVAVFTSCRLLLFPPESISSFLLEALFVLIGGTCVGKICVLVFEKVKIQKVYSSIVKKN